MINSRSWWQKLLPDSLLGRLIVVMITGIISVQLLSSWAWQQQLRETTRQESLKSGKQLAINAVGTLRFFKDLPAQYRPILIEQLRTMGGTRFFVNVNKNYVPVNAIQNNSLVSEVADSIQTELRQHISSQDNPKNPAIAVFAWPEGLVVADDGRKVSDLPELLTDTTFLLSDTQVPILVIQAEIENNTWLYLATTMPDPYFFQKNTSFTLDKLGLSLLTLLTVLVLSFLLVRGLIKPLDKIAHAADIFGRPGGLPEAIPETGTTELRRTAKAFNQMQAHIQRYLLDRERLFQGISHGLKTPIMRLKLRTELLDDDDLRADFNEDLDDLDRMVKAALQSVKDSDIHENIDNIKLDVLLERLATRPIYPDAAIETQLETVIVNAKPLALERAISNLIDNAVLYGKKVQIHLFKRDPYAVVEIRDFGPGIPPALIGAAFEPHTRLPHGQQQNPGGTGLGMGIANAIIQAHSGEIRLHNHAEGGLVVTILLPLGDDTSDS
jgi:signal transduction histidine kinase